MSKNGTTPQLRPGELGYVGRGYPPEHGKIRKGEKRNPWGRKGKKGHGAKEAPLDFASAIAEELAKPVTSKDGTTYTRAQIAINGLMKGVYGGDMRAIKLLLELHDKYPLARPTSDQEQLDAADKAILEDHRRNLLLSYGIDPDAASPASGGDNSRSEDGESAEGKEPDHV